MTLWFARYVRWHLSVVPHGPAVESVLAVSDSQYRFEFVAELPQSADLGRVRGVDVFHGISVVLVHGPGAGFGHAPRSHHLNKLKQVDFLGALSLGWRGSARHWSNYEKGVFDSGGDFDAAGAAAYTVSLVSGTSRRPVIPGWHTTIFPPYFVAGALYLLRIRMRDDAAADCALDAESAEL